LRLNLNPQRSIRRKVSWALIAMAFVFAAFVGVGIAIDFEATDRAAQLEAGHVAELIADSIVENNHVIPNLQEFVTRLNSLRSRDVLILDRDKKGLASSEPEEVGVTYVDDLGDEIGKTIGDGRTRTFTEQNMRHADGQRQIVVPLGHSAANPGDGHIGAVTLEYTSIRERLFAAARNRMYVRGAAVAAFFALVALWGLSFARRIAQPLQELTSSVDRIAAADYGARVVIASHDEIGHLGSAFNKMAGDLSASHAKQVAHEAELEEANALLRDEVRQHRLAADRADYLAFYDPLTGLANRALFRERLDQCMAFTKEHNRKLALVILDIEGFKTINDTLGQPAGNTLLKDVGARLSDFAGSPDRVARIAADHFAIMIPGVHSEEDLAKLIQNRSAEIFGLPFGNGGSELRVSAKCGIALYPGDGVAANALFKNAEVALKSAKAVGDPHAFYAPAMNANLAGRLSLENQLRQAVERGEFVLHYQPKIELGSGKLSGAEALIRWNNPQTGLLVPPNQFIPILEETGLIHEVGRWAKRNAVDDFLRWRAAGLNVVRLAVNVSPLQLRRRGFIDDIKHTVGVDANAAAGLELEITEGVIMEDFNHVVATLKAIRDLGVTIAIDDFGTGFSSLKYLAKLPVDTLKLDRSFVIDMTVGPDGLALVSMIIKLAHSLKLNVVAEGVETEEQSRFLRLLGCDQMQGFLFSKPVPAEIFEARYLVPAAPGT